MIKLGSNIDGTIASIDSELLTKVASELAIDEANYDRAVYRLRQAVRACCELDQRIRDFPALMKKDREAIQQIALSAQSLLSN